MALYASTVGEVFGELILLFGVGLLAQVSLKFGAVETFSILLFAYTIIRELLSRISFTHSLVRPF